MRLPSALVDAAKQRKLVLFAGAGISYDSIGVGAVDLRDAVGAAIQQDYPTYDYTKRSLEEACDEYEMLNDRPTLVDFLAGRIPQSAPPLPSHVAAVGLFRFIVTTNWDLLFEAAYAQINQHRQILVQESDAPMFSFDQHNLLKIHGSADRPSSLVCTTNDYEGYPDTHTQLLDRVADLVYSNTVLFVGHGLQDEHLRRLLYQLRRQRGDMQRRSYVVGFYDEVRKKLLESRKMEVIEEDAAAFLPALAAAV